MQTTDATLKDIDNRLSVIKKLNPVKKELAVFKEINKILRKIEPDFSKTVLNLFKKQENEVLNNLRQNKTHKYTVDGVQFDFDKWVKIFEDEGEPHIAEAVRLAGIQLAKELGSEFDITDPKVIAQIGKRVTSYATITNQTTKEAIDNIIKQSIKDNLSISEATKLIEKYYDGSSKYRAGLVARTETMGGVNLGRLESMVQTDGVNKHTWTTQGDGDVRDIPGDDHTALAGVTVKLGEPFPVGPNYIGDPTYPSDYNERCTTMPRKE